MSERKIYKVVGSNGYIREELTFEEATRLAKDLGDRARVCSGSLEYSVHRMENSESEDSSEQ